MSTAVEPAAPPQAVPGSTPSLLIGSLLGSVVILAGLVAGGYAAAAIPEGTSYAEVARIAAYLGTVLAAVAVGGMVANTNPARGVRGGIILTVSVVIAAAFIAAAFYGNLREGLFGPILAGVTLAAGAFAVFRILTSQQGMGWCRAVDEQGWADFHQHKRSQGLLVRRCTLAGILVLGVTGAYSLFKAEPFNVKKPTAGRTSLAGGEDTAGEGQTSSGATASKIPPPLNYHLPFTEVTDPAGYKFRAGKEELTTLDVEEAVKKHPEVAEAVALSSPGDEVSDRAVVFVELKVKSGKRVGANKELQGQLQKWLADGGADSAGKVRAAVDRTPDLQAKMKESSEPLAKNFDIRFVDKVVKSRNGAVNRHYYHEMEAGREAHEDAAALMPLIPVANLTLPLLLCLATVWIAWRTVNVPTFGDFLIATEAEMNKVSWTPKKRLVQDTIVVLVCLLLLTVFLLVIDLFWGWLLSLDFIGVLPKKTGTGGTAGGELNLKW